MLLINAKKSIISYKIALIINAILMVAVISPLFSQLFPFLINNMKSKTCHEQCHYDDIQKLLDKLNTVNSIDW